MSNVYALLVGVCDYSGVEQRYLPLCKNDLYAMRAALINGLNIDPSSIILCGETGKVLYDDLVTAIGLMAKSASKDSTFIFYFSGHGGKVGGENCIALSNRFVGLQGLLDCIDLIPTKNKVAILDSCHSGDFGLDDVPALEVNESVEQFAGRGFAVLASCGADQESGFDGQRRISLYTRFVCDALQARFLIREGKKTLEAINGAIFHFAKISNIKSGRSVQQPIFRSSIGGTIFFEVEEYSPYKQAKVYEETDRYIIYSVEPVHHGMIKRFSVKVILRFQSTIEEIIEIAAEIRAKLMYCEVYRNSIAEARYKGKASNIIWCYLGYDEDDMVDCNFTCHTTWVDHSQDKSWWYRSSNGSSVINDICIQEHSQYSFIKGLKDNLLSIDELIQATRTYTTKLECVSKCINR